MSKGGGTQTSTTVQKADPWEGVQPALRALYDAALQNFNGPGPQYYPGSTIAPLSPATQDAQQGIYSLATNKSPNLQAAQQQQYSTASGDYLYGNPAMQDLYNFAGHDFMQNTPAMWDLYDSTGENFMLSNPGMPGLFTTAAGSWLNNNPHLDRMFDAASGAVGRQYSSNIMPGIESAFAGAGRFGSNQMAEGLGQAEQEYGNTLTDLAAKIYGGNYASERGMMQQAQGMLGQFGLNAQSQRQAALTNLGQLGLQGRGQQIGAASGVGSLFGSERDRQLTAAGMGPELDRADYYGMMQLANIGGQQDAYNQRVIDADMARYNFGQNQMNNKLDFLNRVLQGGVQLGGSTGTTTSPAPDNTMSGLGNILMLASLFL